MWFEDDVNVTYDSKKEQWMSPLNQNNGRTKLAREFESKACLASFWFWGAYYNVRSVGGHYHQKCSHSCKHRPGKLRLWRCVATRRLYNRREAVVVRPSPGVVLRWISQRVLPRWVRRNACCGFQAVLGIAIFTRYLNQRERHRTKQRNSRCV